MDDNNISENLNSEPKESQSLQSDNSIQYPDSITSNNIAKQSSGDNKTLIIIIVSVVAIILLLLLCCCCGPTLLSLADPSYSNEYYY